MNIHQSRYQNLQPDRLHDFKNYLFCLNIYTFFLSSFNVYITNGYTCMILLDNFNTQVQLLSDYSQRKKQLD